MALMMVAGSVAIWTRQGGLSRLAKAMVLGAALAAALGAGTAFAKDAATLLGIRFPSTVAGFAYQETTNYESKKPGLGYSVYYRHGDQWADVYVYTLGRGNIAQAYDPAASKAQYKQAAGDITEAAARGYYRSAEALGSYPAPSFECGRFSIVGKAGESNDSILCVTTRKGKFLKLRLTGPQGKLSGPSIDGFISAWAKDQ